MNWWRSWSSWSLRGALMLCWFVTTTVGQKQEPENSRIDFMFLNGALVFFMQIGFISLESGYVRAKNVKNILLKNTADALLSGLCWWALGYAFAYGKSAGGFLGYTDFFIQGTGEGDTPWFFSWTFCLCTISIVSGCLAERTDLIAYPIFTIVLSMWVHPVPVHWAWSQDSWLRRVCACEFLDFAGGTVVHVVGGLMGTVGAVIVGPRIGRFEDGKAKPIPGHDISAVGIGTFSLWFGWYGFNIGSIYAYDITYGAVLDRVAMNMTLSASASGLTALLIASWIYGTFDLCVCCNGILSGLVSSSANSGFVAPWAAAVTGIITGCSYMGSSRLFLWLQVDDPLESGSIHFVSGVVGTILNGALVKPQYVQELTGSTCGGFIYDTRLGGYQLGMQLLGVVVIGVWVMFFSFILFASVNYFGYLRVDQTKELAGIDNIDHGGPAYPEFNLVTTAALPA